MALEHAILVSLSERASSGYDLARRFDRSIGQFWSATHQQIYRVLARMESDGWVRVHVVAQEGRPDKKVYEVTSAGRSELAAWLARPSEVDIARSELAVKIRGAGYGDAAAVAAEVRRHRAAHAERLDVYLANEEHEFADPRRLRGRRLHQWLVLRGGIALERTLVDWYDDVLAALAPPRRTPPRRTPKDRP
ncbi:MAG: PadR family transcriptional regulator [Jatrophihabitans sp.]|nr:MAG: PadR family transcriptional regulator [Jatrophihabitans sp.]